MKKPVNNSTFVEEEECQGDFGSVKDCMSFFKSVYLLDMVHKVSTGNILHYKVESIRRLKSVFKKEWAKFLNILCVSQSQAR